MNPAEDQPGDVDEFALQPADAAGPPAAGGRRPSRLGIGWVATIITVLVLAAAGVGAGGYLGWRSHRHAVDLAQADAAAVEAAKDCVTATQAPDVAALTAAQAKIVECSTGDFGAQAGLYSSVLVDAYQAANAKVAVSEMRAAVERHNGDGSIEVLVALRVRVTNTQAADREQGYRLRVQMAPVGGAYKIADLEQVTS